MKLEYRIFASILSTSLIVILAFNVLALYFFNQRTNRLIDSQNSIIVHMVSKFIDDYYRDDGQIDDLEFRSIKNQILNAAVPNGYMYVVDQNRQVIIHPDNEGIMVEGLWYIERMFENVSGNIQYRKDIEPRANDIRRVHYKIHEGTGWLIAAGPSMNRITVVSDNLYLLFIIVTVISIFVSFFISIKLSKKIAQPVNDSFQKIVEMTNDEEIGRTAQKATGIEYEIMKKTISSIKEATKPL